MNPTITGVDLFGDGVMVEFSDGSTAVFSAEFLWQNRSTANNKVIPEPE